MLAGKAGRILFSLFKVSAFLGVGTMIGFFLGLAYASHLYGTTPVVTQMQNWLTGDTLIEGPVAVDQADKKGNLDQGESSLDQADRAANLMSTPVAVIPKIGACIGFGMAVSTFVAAFFLRIFVSAVKQQKAGTKNAPADSKDKQTE